MNKRKTLAIMLLGLVVLPQAHAASENELSYKFFEIGYQQAKATDDSDLKADGMFATGSFALGSNFFMTLGYGASETEDFSVLDPWSMTIYNGSVEMNSMSIGFGGHKPISDNTDFVAQLAFIRGEYDYKGEFSNIDSESDNGWGAGIGIRSLFSSWFELSAGIQHSDIFDDSDTAFTLGLRAHASKLFSVGLSYTKYSDEDQIDLTARFSFH